MVFGVVTTCSFTDGIEVYKHSITHPSQSYDRNIEDVILQMRYKK
jgi:hypothetical protein